MKKNGQAKGNGLRFVIVKIEREPDDLVRLQLRRCVSPEEATEMMKRDLETAIKASIEGHPALVEPEPATGGPPSVKVERTKGRLGEELEAALEPLLETMMPLFEKIDTKSRQKMLSEGVRIEEFNPLGIIISMEEYRRKALMVGDVVRVEVMGEARKED